MSDKKILCSHWYTQLSEPRPVGMVLVQHEHNKMAYIGAGTGITEEADANWIAITGARLPKAVAEAAFKGFDFSDYKAQQ